MSELSNEDLRAVPQDERRWSTWNYAALWIGMSICIPTYQLASGYIKEGMNWKQAILTVLLGNAIVLIPMVLNGHAGAKYGVPFPVFARASFGTRGANVPAMLRAIVACGWFGIQTWIGGTALRVVVEKLFWPGIGDLGRLAETGPFSFHKGDMLCFGAFWVVNMFIVWAGIESIRKLLVVKSVFLPLATFALLVWAYKAVQDANPNASGFGPILSRGARFENSSQFLNVFIPSVTGAVGFWATLSLNIPDFTRYAKGQREQVLGQAIGLPTSMTAVAFVGVAVTSATAMLPAFGRQEQWDPVKIVKTFEAGWLVALAMFCVVLSTLATNIAANIVSPANDFSNLAPRAISFRTGGFITGVVGVVMFPWKLLEDPTGYIFTWLVGYSALLGPIGGILIADYFILRRRQLDVPDLYSPTGRYSYWGGWNPAAVVALVLGILPCVPGFVFKIAPGSIPHFPVQAHVEPLKKVYDFAWFVGFGVSAVVYLVLTVLRRSEPAPKAAEPV